MADDSADAQRRRHAARQATELMAARARAAKTMTYTELADQLTTSFAPNGKPFSELLSAISRSTYAERKVLLSAVVVHADDGIPGDGFFALAVELGMLIEDRRAFWADTVQEVFAAYAD